MATAQELAAEVRFKAEELKRQGEYSVEALAIIEIASLMADLAAKVAALEGLARADVAEVVEEVLRRQGYKPPGRPTRALGER